MKGLIKVIACSLMILLSSFTGLSTIMVHCEGRGLLGADSSFTVEHGMEVEEVKGEVSVDSWMRYRGVLTYSKNTFQLTLDERFIHHSLPGLYDNRLALRTGYDPYPWLKFQLTKEWRKRIQKINPGSDYDELRLETSINIANDANKAISMSHLYVNRRQINRVDADYFHNDYRINLESPCKLLDTHDIYIRYQKRVYPENRVRDYGDISIRYVGTYSFGWPDFLLTLEQDAKEFISSDRYDDSKTSKINLSLRGRPVTGSYFRADVERLIRRVIGNEVNDYLRNTVFFRLRYPLTKTFGFTLYGRNRTLEYVNQPAHATSGDYWIRDGSIDLSYNITDNTMMLLGCSLDHRIYPKRPHRDCSILEHNFGIEYDKKEMNLLLMFEKEINRHIESGDMSIINTTNLTFEYEVDRDLSYKLIYTQIDCNQGIKAIEARLLYEF